MMVRRLSTCRRFNYTRRSPLPKLSKPEFWATLMSRVQAPKPTRKVETIFGQLSGKFWKNSTNRGQFLYFASLIDKKSRSRGSDEKNRLLCVKILGSLRKFHLQPSSVVTRQMPKRYDKIEGSQITFWTDKDSKDDCTTSRTRGTRTISR